MCVIIIAAIKATVVYPATDKHIEKYMYHELFLIDETPELYKEVVLPQLETSQFNIQVNYSKNRLPLISCL